MCKARELKAGGRVALAYTPERVIKGRATDTGMRTALLWIVCVLVGFSATVAFAGAVEVRRGMIAFDAFGAGSAAGLFGCALAGSRLRRSVLPASDRARRRTVLVSWLAILLGLASTLLNMANSSRSQANLAKMTGGLSAGLPAASAPSPGDAERPH